MEWFDTNVGSMQASLQEAPEVFQTVGVNLSANVAFRMVNDFMRELSIQFVVGHQLVSEKRTHRDNVLADKIAQWSRLPIFNYAGANFAATFQYSHYHRLVSLSQFLGAFVLVDVACFGSNESFVHFDLLGTGAADLAAQTRSAKPRRGDAA